ncbi:hypothetical protein [Streptomyces bluensis]|uniref:Uncharacterized protein n=1 Tax=Streptomyces bluensis TaxID=33897 RepID=A0ABW6UUK0_9ACTN
MNCANSVSSSSTALPDLVSAQRKEGRSRERSPVAGPQSAYVAYGDATGLIFLIGAAVAALGIVAAVLLKPVVLRTSLDAPEATGAAPEADETGRASVGDARPDPNR